MKLSLQLLHKIRVSEGAHKAGGKRVSALQTVLSNPEYCSGLDIHIEYQEFSVPGSTPRYPKFCGFTSLLLYSCRIELKSLRGHKAKD